MAKVSKIPTITQITKTALHSILLTIDPSYWPIRKIFMERPITISVFSNILKSYHPAEIKPTIFRV